MYTFAFASKKQGKQNREKSCDCGKHCGLPDYQDHVDLTNDFHTREGLSAHAHNIV